MLAELQPASDDDIEAMREEMLGMALSTDQAAVARQRLEGCTLLCSQAGSLVEAIKVGIVKRTFVLNVLFEKLTDLPEGLEDLVAAFEGPMRDDMLTLLTARRENPGGRSSSSSHISASSPSKAAGAKRAAGTSKAIGAAASKASAASKAGGYPSAARGPPKAAPAGLADAECVQRLRGHASSGRLPADVARDLAEVFSLAGLHELKIKAGRIAKVTVQEMGAVNDLLQQDSGSYSPRSDGASPRLRPEEEAAPRALAQGGAEPPLAGGADEQAFAPEKRKKAATKSVANKKKSVVEKSAVGSGESAADKRKSAKSPAKKAAQKPPSPQVQ